MHEGERGRKKFIDPILLSPLLVSLVRQAVSVLEILVPRLAHDLGLQFLSQSTADILLALCSAAAVELHRFAAALRLGLQLLRQGLRVCLDVLWRFPVVDVDH